MPPMTYTDFQQYCARFGFIETPITEPQFDHCVGCGLSMNEIYGVASDVFAGFDFSAAVSANFYQEYDNA